MGEIQVFVAPAQPSRTATRIPRSNASGLGKPHCADPVLFEKRIGKLRFVSAAVRLVRIFVAAFEAAAVARLCRWAQRGAAVFEPQFDFGGGGIADTRLFEKFFTCISARRSRRAACAICCGTAAEMSHAAHAREL